MLRNAPAALCAALRLRATLYHLHDPELIPIGLALKAMGKRVVFDFHEDVPVQTLHKCWIPRLLRRPVSKAVDVTQRVTTRFFDGLVAATPTIAGKFNHPKVETVCNYPIVDHTPPGQSVPYSKRANRIVYVGGVTRTRGIEQLLDALALLPESLNARLTLIGPFQPASDEAVMRNRPGWERTDYLGYCDRDRIAEELAKARVGMVNLLPIPNYVDCLPVKLFEYMAAGLPVVASNFPILKEIVESGGCGLCVDPSNVDALAAAISRLLNNPQQAEAMGNRGREAVAERMNWNREASRLLKFYADILGHNAQGNKADRPKTPAGLATNEPAADGHGPNEPADQRQNRAA